MENELGPATEKQVAFLRKRGINPANWTKLKASQEIDKITSKWDKKPEWSASVQPQSSAVVPQMSMSARDNNITAQCLTKCAIEMGSSLIDAKAEDIGLCMPSIISVVWGAYKEFLSLLNGETTEAVEQSD